MLRRLVERGSPPTRITVRAAFSTPEARAIRDFMASRRIGGIQQIKMAITFHTAGEQVLWPYGYSHAKVPYDMTSDDHAALAALGGKMAALNGYTPMQSSSLYITDGDEIDWAYGHERNFRYTFEMYPSKRLVTSTARFYPPDEVINPQTERNKGAILRLMDAAGCPYSVIGKATQNCGPLYDDFETAGGWTVRTRTAPTRRRAASGSVANPQATTRRGGHGSVRLSGARHRAARRVPTRTRTTSTWHRRRSARRRSLSRRPSAR